MRWSRRNGQNVKVCIRRDRTIQAIAAKYEVHPNQVSEKDHEATIHDLHAKIGELTVEHDFLSRGLGS